MGFISDKLSQIQINPNELDLPMSDPTQNTVADVMQLVFAVVGAFAVLVITIAGLYFVLSEGNPEKANRARDAIIYAAVGLAISVLATAIIQLVIRNVA